MSVIRLGIIGYEAGTYVYNVLRNSRLFKNEKILTVSNETKKTNIEIASDVTTLAGQIAENGVQKITRDLVGSDVTVPNLSQNPTLIQSLIDGNNLAKSISNSVKNQTVALETIAEVLTNSLAVHYDLMTTLNLGVVAMGNELKAIREIKSETATYQTPLNILNMEKSLFETYGVNTENQFIKDSEGNNIIPMHEKAKYHAEKRIDEEKMNKFNWGSMLNSIAETTDDILDEGTDLLNQIINAHKLSPDSIKKIDDEIKKINWGDSNVNE